MKPKVQEVEENAGAEPGDGGLVITGIRISVQFGRGLKKLKGKYPDEAKDRIRQLLFLKVSEAPAKLHLHPLSSKTVASMLDPNKKIKVYTFHISADDKYKASFTIENGEAYLRVCGEHDWIDKNP